MQTDLVATDPIKVSILKWHVGDISLHHNDVLETSCLLRCFSQHAFIDLQSGHMTNKLTHSKSVVTCATPYSN